MLLRTFTLFNRDPVAIYDTGDQGRGGGQGGLVCFGLGNKNGFQRTEEVGPIIVFLLLFTVVVY
jgi:hypothetical protein